MRPREWTTTTSFLDRLEDFGDDTGWRSFLDRYEPPLRSLIHRMGFRSAEIDDVFQEVLLSFATSWKGGGYDPARGRFSSWLFGIAYRRVVDALERRGLRRRLDDAVSTGDLDPRRETESTWELECRAMVVRSAVAQLRKETDARGALVLQEVILDDHPPRELAARLGVEANVVYQTKFRLLGRLREITRALEASE